MKWTHDVGIFIFGYSHVLWLVASFPIGLIIPLFSNTKVEYPMASTKMPSQVCKLVYVHQVNSVFVYIYMIYIYMIHIYIYDIYIYRCPLYIQNSCCSDFNQEIHGTSCFYLETYQTNTHTHTDEIWWNIDEIWNISSTNTDEILWYSVHQTS